MSKPIYYDDLDDKDYRSERPRLLLREEASAWGFLDAEPTFGIDKREPILPAEPCPSRKKTPMKSGPLRSILKRSGVDYSQDSINILIPDDSARSSSKSRSTINNNSSSRVRFAEQIDARRVAKLRGVGTQDMFKSVDMADFPEESFVLD